MVDFEDVSLRNSVRISCFRYPSFIPIRGNALSVTALMVPAKLVLHVLFFMFKLRIPDHNYKSPPLDLLLRQLNPYSHTVFLMSNLMFIIYGNLSYFTGDKAAGT
jgi:hypothetical protein